MINYESYLHKDNIAHSNISHYSQKIVQDLTMKNVWNIRDLGGYKTKDDKMTKMHAFIRSSNTDKLNENDIKKLKDYGISTVIDLRTAAEIIKWPDILANVQGIKYYNIEVDYCDTDKEGQSIRISDSYINIIRQKGIIKRIFEIIASSGKGGILFHCASGRDRTGIISALLLGLAHVDDEDIVKDYLQTFDNIRNEIPYQEYIANGGIPVPSDEILVLEIKKVIQYIKNEYESFEKYLLCCGLNEELISIIKNKIILNV